MLPRGIDLSSPPSNFKEHHQGAYQFHDMLVSAIYDYDKFVYFDLQEFWFVSDKRDSRTVFIFHDLFTKWSIVH